MGNIIFRVQQATIAPLVDRRIPRVALQPKHIERCRLLLDRQQLLEQLPTGGVCAEIGVDQGDFTARILATCRPKRLHLVDLWGSRRYSQTKCDQVRQKFSTQVADGTVVIHRKSSLEAAGGFDDAMFDWVYLDTTHAYQLTAAELQAYARKIKPGGYLAGHDYVMGNWSKVLRYGVVEAVHEFCVNQDWELAYLTAEPTENQSFALRRVGDSA